MKLAIIAMRVVESARTECTDWTQIPAFMWHGWDVCSAEWDNWRSAWPSAAHDNVDGAGTVSKFFFLDADEKPMAAESTAAGSVE